MSLFKCLPNFKDLANASLIGEKGNYLIKKRAISNVKYEAYATPKAANVSKYIFFLPVIH